MESENFTDAELLDDAKQPGNFAPAEHALLEALLGPEPHSIDDLLEHPILARALDDMQSLKKTQQRLEKVLPALDARVVEERGKEQARARLSREQRQKEIDLYMEGLRHQDLQQALEEWRLQQQQQAGQQLAQQEHLA